MFCIGCGSEIAAEAKFCGKCGTKVDAAPTGATAGTDKSNTRVEQVQPKFSLRRSPIVIFGGGFIGLVVLLILYGALIGQSPNQTKSVPSQETVVNKSGAPQKSAESKWQKGHTYTNFSDGSCRDKDETICLTDQQYREACSAAEGVTSRAVRLLAVNAGGDEKVLLNGGDVDDTKVFWGKNYKGEGCGASVTVSGIANGNSSRKVITGRATSFVVSDKGKLLVSYIDQYD